MNKCRISEIGLYSTASFHYLVPSQSIMLLHSASMLESGTLIMTHDSSKLSLIMMGL